MTRTLQPQRAWLRYGAAALSVAAGAGLRAWLPEEVGSRAAFITFYPVVIFSALFGGLGAGLLTVVLSALVVDYFWMGPAYRFGVGDAADSLALAFFVFSGSAIAWTAAAKRRAQERAGAAEATAAYANERRQAAENLRQVTEREHVLAEALETMAAPFAMWSADGILLLFNQAFANLTGRTRSELEARRSSLAADLSPAEWRSTTEAALEQARRTGQPVRYRKEWVRSDGARVPIEVFLHTGFDESGALRRYYSMIEDITERQRTEEGIRQSQKLESLGLLAGGVAHDFNNLLVGVIGNTSLALDMLRPDDPAVELLKNVMKTGDQLAHLTRQMLAYSGKGRFQVEPLNLSDVVPDMVALIQPAISKKIALNFALQGGLPPIEADRSQIQQVVMNLVLNASEAIGSVAGSISIRTTLEDVDEAFLAGHPEAASIAPGRYVALEVADTGKGMDDATKAKIFDPFFSTKFIGRGLGLAAVSGIVRGHKGAILVKSATGRGASFTILLPATQGHAAAQPSESPRSASPGSGTILVVDDEMVVRETAGRALERCGYNVLSADGGAAAIDALKRHPGEVAAVLLDLSMPGMGGEEVLPELRKIRPGIKVIVSSGYSECEAMRLFQGLEVSGFVQKPYTVAVLAEKVKDVVGTE